MDTDVLIVGAGPSGLTLACELLRHGLPCRIIDQNEAASDKSKAIALQARSLEVLDDLGVVEEALGRGHKMHGLSLYHDNKRVAHVTYDDIDSPYPFVLILPQPETERLLERVASKHNVKVERRTRLTALEQDSDGVVASIEGPAGKSEEIRARWLVGADGAHSTTRKLLDMPFEGAPYPEDFRLADVKVEWPYPPDEAHFFLTPHGLLLGIPLSDDGMWRMVADVPEGDAIAQGARSEADRRLRDPTIEEVREYVETRGPKGTVVGTPNWLSQFRIHRRLVPSYRTGNVFLSGDSAHVHSPLGGQGMNMGIQDAYNLAWKLALVGRKKGRPELLDTYHDERRPIAALVLRGTGLATRVVALRNPIARHLHGQVASFLTSFEAVQNKLASAAAELNLNYRKSKIVAQDRASVLSARLEEDLTVETPTLGDFRDFGSAPRAGDRAPDCRFGKSSGADEPGSDRLFDRLRGPHHTLLLFDGAAPTKEGYERLAAISEKVRARMGDLIKVHVIIPTEERPLELAKEPSVLFDAGNALHQRYGAGSECLYLVRPDGYIAYRSQPADGAKLFAYLERIFL